MSTASYARRYVRFLRATAVGVALLGCLVGLGFAPGWAAPLIAAVATRLALPPAPPRASPPPMVEEPLMAMLRDIPRSTDAEAESVEQALAQMRTVANRAGPRAWSSIGRSDSARR